MTTRPKKKLDYKLKYVDFNEREKAEYEIWIGQQSRDLSDAIYQFCDLHCKTSFSMDQNTGAYLVSVTPKDTKLPIHGNVFMFRHNALDKCILIALFFYVEVLNSGDQKIEDKDDLDW
jgi:hypothetical protein